MDGTNVIYMFLYKLKYVCKGYSLYKINDLKDKAFSHHHNIWNIIVLKLVSSESLWKKV